MSLVKGDHVVIKRGDKILTEIDEAYHEFEVMDYPKASGQDDGKQLYEVVLKVVK